MAADFPDDPFKLLSCADRLNWPPLYEPYTPAIRVFDPENPEPLASLLKSDNPVIARRGLVIFGELGRKAYRLVDLALNWTDHPVQGARIGLMEGMMCNTRHLNSEQLSQVLPLAEDPEPLVRYKVATILAFISMEILIEAIHLIDDEAVRARHLDALDRLSCAPGDTQKAFDDAMTAAQPLASYLFASIVRVARRDETTLVPVYGGDDFEAQSTLANAARLLKNLRRRIEERRAAAPPPAPGEQA